MQLMSVPPYVSAFVFSMATSYFSDKYRLRAPFILFWTLIAVIGYAIWLGSNSNSVKYGAIVLQITGIYGM